MNIALVTNTKLHHKYWASQLCISFNVKLIVHPSSKRKNIKSKLFGSKNFLLIFLKILSVIYNFCSKSSIRNQLKKYEEIYFKKYISNYNSIDKRIIHHVDSINDKKSIELFKKNNIHIICFLGGDIVKKSFFNNLDVICLNYHSGISPYYNGNKTVFHAFSDYRPNFAGGTLMKMNERIDGGEILAHYITKINDTDNAYDVFMKGIVGSVKLYKHALNNTEMINVDGILQEKSFRFLNNHDWNLINDIKLNNFHKSKRIKHYCRDEKIIIYDKRHDLKYLYSQTLQEILKK